MFSIDDLPHRVSPTTGLRRTISTVIETEFKVTDDHLREAKDSHGGRFNPNTVSVRINLDSGNYEVTMSGPAFGSQAQSYGTYAGDHFLDCDEHRHSLVVEAVIACLRAHGKIKEG